MSLVLFFLLLALILAILDACGVGGQFRLGSIALCIVIFILIFSRLPS